jgi:hypothetical protein
LRNSRTGTATNYDLVSGPKDCATYQGRIDFYSTNRNSFSSSSSSLNTLATLFPLKKNSF